MTAIKEYATYLEDFYDFAPPSPPTFANVLYLFKHAETIKTELLYDVQEFEVDSS